MRQVVQSVADGELRVVELPRPQIGPTQVLVAPSRSLVSAGTERAVRQLAQSSLVAKARARPDLVRQVVAKARSEGVGATVRSVRSRLDEDMPLGYSSAGTVVEVGEAVDGVRVGQRVATGGAGHAELQIVQGPLAVPVPENVSDEEAAFATVGAIALHGLRLADVGPGAKVCVIGLGLVGQLTVRLARAAGLDVAAIDVRDWTVERAREAGALGLVEAGDDTTDAVLEWSRGRGADAVLLTAATKSSDPVRRAPALARDRAPVVVVGDLGLELDRTPFYEKELELRFARSYGPGRYDRSYEDLAIDYPIGHVRWTEGRNIEAFLDLVAGGMTVADLVTHRFAIDEASEAYALLDDAEARYLGVQLTYADDRPADPTVIEINPRRTGGTAVGIVGAGNFTRATLLPALERAGWDRLAAVTSATGLSARHLAERSGIERVISDVDALLADDEVEVVMITTPHDTHAELVLRALAAGKHVFCEKPLALTRDELDSVDRAWRAGTGQLMVGFNRRHSPAVTAVRQQLGSVGGPLVVTYRVNAGRLPESHWYNDRRQGGRLLGEVCHFVDTATALVGTPVRNVYAAAGGGGEPLLADDLTVTLAYEDGSLAAITYAAGGHAGTAKERVEVLGRGHTAVIDDYTEATVDGKRLWKGAQDKGHAAELELLRRMIEGTEPDAAAVTESALASTAATLAAAESVLRNRPVEPQRR